MYVCVLLLFVLFSQLKIDESFALGRGMAAQASKIAAQPVGFASAIKAAEERILALQATGKLHPKQPIVAVENFLLEVGENK